MWTSALKPPHYHHHRRFVRLCYNNNSIINNNNKNNHVTSTTTANTQKLYFSDWSGARGYDLTQDLLTSSAGTNRLKVALHGFGTTGFDVSNSVKKVDPNEVAESGSIHMNGSVIVFPYGCFLWNVKSPKDVTLESLAPILLHRPQVEYLFIGCNDNNSNNNNNAISRQELDRIKFEMSKRNIMVEKLNLSNAMGTFNILNAEGRQVAVALVLDANEEE